MKSAAIALLSALTLVAAMPPLSRRDVSISSPAVDINSCLGAHNSDRAQDGKAPLSWSTDLQASAQSWADFEANRGGGESHSGGPHGENIYQMMSSGDGIADCDAAVAAFYSEKKFFTPGQKFGDGNWESYGHYTQVVWGTTTQVGCARAVRVDPSTQWKTTTYIVCQYEARGNVMGETIPDSPGGSPAPPPGGNTGNTGSGCSQEYIVVSGDTCWAIANGHSESVDQLTAANPGIDCNNLQVGQQVCVGSGSSSSGSPGCTQYTVASGDICWGIANSHGETVDQLQAKNAGLNCNDLQIGQVLCV